jgi:hypothetical protein
MLRDMQTITVNELVSATFEACVEFETVGDGSPVCAGCGWLEAEHEPGVAEVHTLPTRPASRPGQKRLAS